MIRPPRKSRLWRVIGRIAAALGVIVVLAIALLGGLLWYSRPPSDQAAAISGLSAPVSITMDEDRVPRTRAAARSASGRLLPAADRDVLEAYARGVNAWISARGRFSAPEFIFLGAP